MAYITDQQIQDYVVQMVYPVYKDAKAALGVPLWRLKTAMQPIRDAYPDPDICLSVRKYRKANGIEPTIQNPFAKRRVEIATKSMRRSPEALKATYKCVLRHDYKKRGFTSAQIEGLLATYEPGKVGGLQVPLATRLAALASENETVGA